MALINPDLIARIATKLGIQGKAVYPRITKIVNETALERHLAALVLGMRQGVNINKYSTTSERAEIRGVVGKRNGDDDRDEPRERVAVGSVRRSATRARKSKRKTPGTSVFVVHGRDEPLRKSMFEFLRALGLHPMEWDHALREARSKGANPYVGDILDRVMEQAQAVVVMFTPDDLVQLKEQLLHVDDGPTERRQQGQARPNVLFEAGLAMGRHPSKTILVQIGKVKGFSDVGGRHMVRLTDSTESRNDLANRLEDRHCEVNRVGRDWMKAGIFVPTEPKVAKKR